MSNKSEKRATRREKREKAAALALLFLVSHFFSLTSGSMA